VPSAELAAAVEGVEEAIVNASASSRGEIESGQQPVQQQDQVQHLQQQERQEQLQQEVMGEQQVIGASAGIDAAAADTAVRQVADGSLEADEVDVLDVTESGSSIAISDISPSQQQQHSSPQQQQQLAVMPSLPEVDFIERIGRGSFGEVYRGVWCGSVVAVKVIRVRQQPAASRNRAACGQTTAVATTPPGMLFNGGSCCSNSSSSNNSSASEGAGQEPDEHEQQVAMELAQHEYESWLNANLRHPNIVQLFTSFTVVLEDRLPQLLLLPSAAPELVHEGAGWAAGLSWKTHLVMEFCELGTMQVGGSVTASMCVQQQVSSMWQCAISVISSGSAADANG
jgi:hypothetical protein